MNARRYRLTALGKLLPLRWFPWLLAVLCMLLSVPRGAYERAVQAAGLASPQPYLDDTHPKQRALVLDERKRIAVQGGRRGGKTQGLARRLLIAGDKHPGETSAYVTLTRGRARDILWDKCLERLNRRYSLGLTIRELSGLLYIFQPNGSKIWLVGVDDKGEVDKLRGGFFSEVVVDEAMAMPEYLKELVEDAIEPALLDLQGALVIAGSPSPLLVGYFHEATTGSNPDVEQWPVHQFTILDNSHLPHGVGFLAEKLKKDYGNNPEHPTYRREWLGQWVEDLGALVYPFTYAGNGWSPAGEEPYGLPPGEYRFGLGVDIGFSEKSTAFTLAARRAGTGQLYLLRSYTRSRLIPTALAAHVQTVRDEVERVAKCSLTVVVDEGALGRGFAEQMREMGVGCRAAEKSEKRAYQEYVGGLIRASSPPYNDNGTWQGGFGVLADFGQCQELIEEARKLQFDDETGKENELYRRHCCDSALYIIRALMPRYEPKQEPPKPGSKEALRLEQKRMKEETWKRIEKRRKGEV